MYNNTKFNVTDISIRNFIQEKDKISDPSFYTHIYIYGTQYYESSSPYTIMHYQ